MFRMPCAGIQMKRKSLLASYGSNLMIRDEKGRMPRRAFTQGAVLAGFLLFPSLAGAQQEATRFQQDPVEQVGARLLVALAVIGIGLVIYSLVKYKGAAI